MRTRAAAAGLILLALWLTGCGQGAPAPGPSATAAPATVAASASSAVPSEAVPPTDPGPTVASCLTLAQELTLAEQVGQLYMMGINAGTPVATAIAQMQASGAGAVILLGNRTDGVASIAQYTGRLRDASAARSPVLVAVDQEGGLVQRLQGPGFDTIPAAVVQGQASAADLRADWQLWGGQLRQAGALFNLAPVADVVPADQVATNQAIGQLDRGFGSDADLVAGQVAAVVHGLGEAGVASSVKHFPGLGLVPENTDLAVGHDRVSQLTDAELLPFQAAIDAGVSSVMVSSAIYTQVDAANPAVFSSTIIDGILRQRMGFDGVVISDDLGVAASVAGYPVAQRGLGFLRAGGDLVIVADPVAAQAMVDATLTAAQTEPALADQLAAKVARLFALKTSVGLMACS